MRRPVKNRKQPGPDEIYGSVKVSKLINYVMERGKKDTAAKIVYKVLEALKKDPKGRKLLNAKPGAAKRRKVSVSGTRTADTYNLESIRF